MKKAKKNNTLSKYRIRTRVNKDLDKYDGKVLFPEKLAKVNKMLKGVKIPT